MLSEFERTWWMGQYTEEMNGRGRSRYNDLSMRSESLSSKGEGSARVQIYRLLAGYPNISTNSVPPTLVTEH